ncbi:hypothetical protein G3I40_12445 [Streptomyces sp. SID14478]|uniref:DUF6328 family protein n=1 Tax=Streptomyces sp. SID14478 TaxID=2706073 RepID=UPI0013DB2333|nr:DUF6328 family protein [Streptomyces sp. SID14478]NEB76025.1 hypothetical protein [Streptomyces sp. SID14478]
MGALNPERGRRESVDQRADRMWMDLVQEMRVALTGVQILFGFLLTVVFTPRFPELSDTDRTIYVVTVLLGSASTGALIGPVAFHRLVSGRRIKAQAVRWASRLTMVGLVLLLCTLTSALLLILRVAMHDWIVPFLVGAILAWYVLCWFLLPLWARGRYTETETDGSGASGPRS